MFWYSDITVCRWLEVITYLCRWFTVFWPVNACFCWLDIKSLNVIVPRLWYRFESGTIQEKHTKNIRIHFINNQKMNLKNQLTFMNPYLNKTQDRKIPNALIKTPSEQKWYKSCNWMTYTHTPILCWYVFYEKGFMRSNYWYLSRIKLKMFCL